ncbi:MAG: cobalamin biosynthesis protein CobQ [Alphaproteobacteria bacterium]|nr:cobalamin biosynthesis protein CobQ [Alphaproteobacteria bacterium SS10]
MNTPTHIALGFFALCRPDLKGEGQDQVAVPGLRDHLVVLAGSLAPDAILYVLYAYARLVQGLTDERIFRVEYFSDSWQSVLAIGNSAPLYAALLAAGVAAKLRPLWLFAAAALLHIATDLPLHHDDGHAHLWPFTMWKFESPVSYWDPAHFGNIAMPVEAALFTVLCVALFRRYQNIWARGGILLVLTAQLIGFAYWAFIFGG